MKLKDITSGTIITVDDGFDCMSAGLKIVSEDEHGLFVPCIDGKHYLEGQEDLDGDLVGIY